MTPGHSPNVAGRRRPRERGPDSPPAAVAARAVAEAMDRGHDLRYVAYLTALGLVTSPHPRDQDVGVAEMADLARDPEYEAEARATLRDFLDVAAERRGRPAWWPTVGRRLSGRAIRAAREALRAVEEGAIPPATPTPPRPARATRTPLFDGVRLLCRAVKGEPVAFALVVAGAVVFGLSTAAIAGILNTVVGRVWQPAVASGHVDPSATVMTAVTAFAVFAGRAGGLFVHRVAVRSMRVRLQATHQRALLDRFLGLPVTWHQRQSPKHLVATADVATKAAWRPLAPLPLAVGGLVLLVAAATGLWLLDWLFALIGLGLLVTLIAVNLVFLRRVGPHVHLAKTLRDRVFEITQQTFAAPGAAPSREAVPAFTATSEQLREVMIRVRQLRGAYLPMLGALPGIGALAALAASLSRPPGADNAADLVSAVFLFTSLSWPVLAVGSVLAEVPRGVQGWERVRPILDARGDMTYGMVTLDARAATVRFQDVHFGPHTGPRLRAVNLDIPASGLTVVVGPAAPAAASAIGRLAARLVDAERGVVAVSGVDIRAATRDSISSTIAYVPRTSGTPSGSLGDYLAAGHPDAREEALWRALRLVTRTVDLRLPDGLYTDIRGPVLDQLGYPLAVARAMVGRPGLLVLELPAEASWSGVVAAVRATNETTVLVVTGHPPLLRTADTVVYVNGSGEVTTGTHRSLIATEPSYAELFRRPPPATAGRARPIRRATATHAALSQVSAWPTTRHGPVEELEAASSFMWSPETTKATSLSAKAGM